MHGILCHTSSSNSYNNSNSRTNKDLGSTGTCLRLRLDHLQPFVLDAMQESETSSSSSSSSLRLVKRSQTSIYENYLEGLARLLEQPLRLDPNRPLGAICRAMFGRAEVTLSEPEVAQRSLKVVPVMLPEPEVMLPEQKGIPLASRTTRRQPLVLFDENLRQDVDKLQALGRYFHFNIVSLINSGTGT